MIPRTLSYPILGTLIFLISCFGCPGPQPLDPPSDLPLPEYAEVVVHQWLQPRFDEQTYEVFEQQGWRDCQTIAQLDDYFVNTIGEGDADFWNFQDNVVLVIKERPEFVANPVPDEQLLKWLIKALDTFRWQT